MELTSLIDGVASLPIAVFVADLDRRIPDQEYWLRMLLRLPAPVVVTAEVEADQDGLGREAVQSSREVQAAREEIVDETWLREEFPHWIGIPLDDDLAQFLDVQKGLRRSHLVEVLTYMLDSGAIELVHGAPHVRLSAVDLSKAEDDLLDVLRGRVGLLSEEQRRVLEALAVFDAPIGLAELEHLDALNEVESGLHRLIDDGFAVRAAAEEGFTYAPAGAAVRDAVVAGADTTWVRTLHGQAADALVELRRLPETDPGGGAAPLPLPSGSGDRRCHDRRRGGVDERQPVLRRHRAPA